MMVHGDRLLGFFLVLATRVVAFSPTSSPAGTQATSSMPHRMPHRMPRTPRLHSLPKLIVFDLDNTLWTPELYQLRNLQRENATPKAGKDVRLMKGTKDILKSHVPALQEQGVQFAVASRTKSVEWAHALLGQFGLKEVFTYIEIFPGNKKKHFQNIHDASQVPYDDMLFFDDARDGKYGNCQPVAEMGVLSVHCPNGIETEEMFTTALEQFKAWDKAPSTIVEADGRMTTFDRTARDSKIRQGLDKGTVKMLNSDKRYGFLRFEDGNSRDVFFHFRHLVEDSQGIQEGDQVTFSTTRDAKNGKKMAINVAIESSVDTSKTTEFKCFSMNQPFAALLASGFKTLETRNGTMFTQYAPGTKMLLHVGRRTYPDGDKHMEIMRANGLDDDEIQKLKSLPAGDFGRGNIVAILELGRTYETTIEERSAPDFQRNVVAYGADSGRLVTEIKRAQYLKRPVAMSGQAGVFKVRIDPEVIPEGWENSPAVHATSFYASISG